MPRYIDLDNLGRGKANRDVFKIPEYADGWNSAIELIYAQTTADVQEVRHGRWKQAYNNYPQYVCSNCNHLFNNKSFKFCPNCGAKMDGKE